MSDVPHRPPREVLVPPGGADLHARDMTATFAADVTLADAQARLAGLGQWLPVDGDPDAALGHLVDANSTGPLRLGYGAWRDLLLGVQFRNGRGELVSAGGRTVKNVAGYDLTKFIVGQHGSFGTLLTLTTRTYRRPAGAVLATFDGPATAGTPSPAERVALLLPSPLKPQWAVLTGDGLLCGYLGDERTLAFYRDRLPTTGATALARSVDEDVAHRRALWCFAGPTTFRASVPPARVADFVAAAGLDRWSADPAFGVVVGDVPACGAGVVMKAAADVGGTAAIVDRAVSPPRVTFPPGSDVEREVIARLQRAFGMGGERHELRAAFPHAGV